MQELKNLTNLKVNEKTLLDSFYESLKNDGVKELRNLIPLDDKTLAKYTSLMEDAANEYQNCKQCKGLAFCLNQIPGYCYFPEVKENLISFSYIPCKYKTKDLESNHYQKYIRLFDLPKGLKNAKIKDFYIDDKSRKEVYLYINSYLKSYFSKREKGLYLYGNFGSGKTYLIAALFNELAKKEVHCAIIYFPEFLRTLKASFTEHEEGTFSERYEYIRKIPLLLIDDIGAENVTAWGRDEILGTLLQYRMEENLPTFFTSNLSLEELETHLSIGKNTVDHLKARRIIERIKYLSKEIKLVGVDRRK